MPIRNPSFKTTVQQTVINNNTTNTVQFDPTTLSLSTDAITDNDEFLILQSNNFKRIKASTIKTYNPAGSGGSGGSGGTTDPSFANVVLLLNAVGNNGSTSIIDTKSNILNLVGNTQISTAQAKFISSIYFDGSGDFITIPISSNLNILSGDFCIETWYYTPTLSGTSIIIAQWQQINGQGGFILARVGNQIAFAFGAYTEDNYMFQAGTIQANYWHYIGIKRVGNLFSLWLDGTQLGSVSSSAVRSQLNIPISLGNYYNSAGNLAATGVNDLQGYIAPLRITKGDRDLSIIPTAVFPAN